MNPETTVWAESALVRWIVFAPLLSAAVGGFGLALLRRPLPYRIAVGGACLSVLTSFVLSAVGFAQLVGLMGDAGAGATTLVLVDTLYTWVGAGVGPGAFSADLAFRYDALSAVMCGVITGVGFLIHLYSIGYMRADGRDDGGVQRYFCYLNLFVAAMLVLVLADNLLLMFMGWEGVGLCSWLLIGFWYGDARNAYAASKAFIVNRVGDFGLLVGIVLLFWSLARAGTPAVSFRAIEAGFAAVASEVVALPPFLGGAEVGLATVIGLCFFLGAVGKSAQLPLHVWLPDAMAGPTPVSALIHAATMVTAGVYLCARLSFLYEAAPVAGAWIAWTGAVTGLFAALAASAQDDIKKVLAYSTISQLGAMFMAVGCGAYTVAVFHLVTHAFFKALLFLGAGAVIVAADHQQDMQQLGGLRKRLTTTYWLMVVGVLAICGFPGLSGFFSKDEILSSVFVADGLPGNLSLYGIGVGTAGLTAFYMFRLLFLTFHGKTRLPRGRRDLDDPEDLMLWPMQALAVLAVLGGIVGMPQFWGDLMEVAESDSLGVFLSQVVVVRELHHLVPGRVAQLMGLTLAVSGMGFGAAYVLYVSRPGLRTRLAPILAWPWRMLARAFWVDAIYDAVIVRPLLLLSDRVLYRGVDVGIVDRLVVGSAAAVRVFAETALKHLHSGLAQAYLLMVLAGTVAIFAYLVA